LLTNVDNKLEEILDFIGSIYFQTWLGAISAHFLSLYSKDFKGTIPFLKKIIPYKSDTFYYRVDLIILPLIGTLIACMVIEPVNLKTSFFAGISWSGTLIALLTNNNNNNSNDKDGDN